jgi:hypothetical protein
MNKKDIDMNTIEEKDRYFISINSLIMYALIFTFSLSFNQLFNLIFSKISYKNKIIAQFFYVLFLIGIISILMLVFKVKLSI